MLSVINEHQMEYEIGPHSSGGVFLELNEAELGKFSSPIVLVQDPFLYTLEKIWMHSLISLIPKYEI